MTGRRPERVYVDANELFPFTVMDVILALAPGGDPDDRVRTAAAIAGGASVLVTRNRRDFPIQHLSQHGVAVMSADEFLSRLLRRRPAAVVETIRRVAAEKRRPALTPCDIVGRLARAGTTTFAGRLARRLGCNDTL